MKIVIRRMDILIFSIMSISVFSLMHASCQKVHSQENIYGFWEGDLHAKELMFEFNNDQTCVLSFKDKVSDSVEILNGNFEMDFSKKPFSLSIRNIPQLDHPLYTIVEFIGSDSIRLAHFAPRWKIRPVAFKHNISMNLKRVKK